MFLSQNRMRLTNLKYFSKGKRSKVYTNIYKNKKVIVKYSYRAKIEANWLKKLSKLDFVPKLLFSDKEKIVYEFIEGEPILVYIQKVKNSKPIIKQILKQCFELDKLKINKKELTNPYKHILIKNKKAMMIDFERCYETENPKNVTQFAQYIMSRKMDLIFKEKGFILDKNKFKKALKNYKSCKTKSNFSKILRFF